jgi:PAS domain S-box-containing protein
VLALGVAYVVVQHGVMGSAAPQFVYGHDGGMGHPWQMALVHGLFVLAAAAALVANWSAHAMVRLRERRNSRQLERYLDAAGVQHLVLDTTGRVRMANRMTLETLQRTREEFVGADRFAIAVPAGEAAARRADFAGMLTGERDRHELDNRVVCADGSVRLVEWVVTHIRDDAGRVTGTLSSGTDVTERRAIEAGLAREQRDLAVLRRLAQDVASLDDARAAVVARVVELTDATFGALFEPASGGRALCVTTSTLPEFADELVALDATPSAAVTAFRDGEPVFVGEAAYHAPRRPAACARPASARRCASRSRSAARRSASSRSGGPTRCTTSTTARRSSSRWPPTRRAARSSAAPRCAASSPPRSTTR